jgi:hypothetical protein
MPDLLCGQQAKIHVQLLCSAATTTADGFVSLPRRAGVVVVAERAMSRGSER